MYELGDIDGSPRLSGESLKIRRDLDEKNGIAASLINIAETSMVRAELPSAMSMYEEALEFCRKTGNKALEAYSLSGVGQVSQSAVPPRQ